MMPWNLKTCWIPGRCIFHRLPIMKPSPILSKTGPSTGIMSRSIAINADFTKDPSTMPEDEKSAGHLTHSLIDYAPSRGTPIGKIDKRRDYIMTMSKFPHIEQFRNVIRKVKDVTCYSGKDESGKALYK